ncbi:MULTISPECIES: adenosylcobalamin-dependent ribonucleoside-diphosphate reductase [unclassified Thioalkalivibrio]|uniref:adenosylcobalamin-dependent ribonucleoside-diphosphate reductase n=1 Tax=unclassified Thioalkalivibrio TaxID=2621013 RepID=UPI000570E3A7|nr:MULTISPECIES: adenosylcobalamin-dependent ribonucleoside-diphosphate reductase [unclassified Thioalkalivibrio]
MGKSRQRQGNNRLPRDTSSDVPLQPSSASIWAERYQLRDAQGEPVDASMEAMFDRVARALAAVEAPDKRASIEREFRWALDNGAIPAGRILANAGAEAYTPQTTLINCTVSRTIRDSLQAILEANTAAGLTLKAGAGIGYDFSTLRPKGALVAGAGAPTNGPVAFMQIFDQTCRTIGAAGGRRGAQMATLDIGHPDIERFILAKRRKGRLTQFNLSVLVRDAFLEAVERDDEWALAFPLLPVEQDRVATSELVYRDWPVVEDGYRVDDQGRVACRIYRRVRARELWDTLMRSTYDVGEPGVILIDQVNRENNAWFDEVIRATNPCGEEPLPPDGACLLGSVNLTRFVSASFTADAAFDWARFERVVRVFTRMLDNVADISGLPLPEQRAEMLRKRRHGMGILGLGSALAMLGETYGSESAADFTAEVCRRLALESWRAGLELAREKGPAPIMDEDFTLTADMLRRQPALAEAGYQAGDVLKGRELHARFSPYMQRIAEEDPALVAALAEEGARFTHATSIAPTGTISFSVANNASNGIEPTFLHHTTRNIRRPGRRTREAVDCYSFELLAYRARVDAEAGPGDLPANAITADRVSVDAHIRMQAAAQPWVDSAISKTLNVPSDIPFEDFQQVYLQAWRAGLKGCTTYRPNPQARMGVLVDPERLRSTWYTFTLADGRELTLRGDEEVEYEGQVHTAANLFAALDEGYYDDV